MSDVENLLETLINGNTTNIKPGSRMEAYLLALINGNTNVPDPQSRAGAYLYTLCKNGIIGSDGSVESLPNGDEVRY